VGMASLAVLLQQAGVQVSGADVPESFVTDKLLNSAGITVESFDAAQLPPDTQGVIYSGAHKGSNHPLVQAAQAASIPTLTLAQATGSLTRQKSTVVTCGVGGKSTTSAWLSLVLQLAGFEPSYSVGVGTIPNLGTSGQWQSGEWFVVEGDEYVADPTLPQVTPRFLYLQPTVALCTGVAYDHPDVYDSWEDTIAAFSTLWQRLPARGCLVVPEHEPGVEAVLAKTALQAPVIRVGQSESADVQWSWQPDSNGSRITLKWRESGETLTITTLLPGEHNALNAALVAVTARFLGAPLDAIAQGLQEFRSTPRRFEYRGQTSNSITCFDDYAHHPRELKAISQTLESWFADQNVTVAFQPHTFSRTKALFNDFVDVLADMPGELCLLPIFASAREAADDETKTENLVAALQERGKLVHFVQTPAELVEYVQTLPGPGVFITLGAGDIYTVYEHLTLHPSPHAVS
jgi:UDP-N-acetylmuramate--alanine ligase